jgi:tetratricopeptide (TPR) repeat protein
VNRERLLFVVVVAIVLLWLFAIREAADPVKNQKTKTVTLEVLRVGGSGSTPRLLALPQTGTFTLKTNETPYPRPPLTVPKAYGLPNLWPPTSRSVGIELLGRLRRPAAAPTETEGSLALPPLPARAGAAAAQAGTERVDQWTSLRAAAKGRVTGIFVNGSWFNEPPKPPAVGEDALKPNFYYFLALLEVDQDRAKEEGVTSVRAKLSGAGTLRQSFPDEMHSFRVGVEGEDRGYVKGLVAAIKFARLGYERQYREARELLRAGVEANDQALIRWSLWIFEKARQQVSAGAQQDLRKILLDELDAANRLNEQELVLRLAFEHLSQFREEEAVLEYVGNILASRSFGVPELAEEFFARAASSPSAQRRRVEVLIGMGRFDDARSLLARGRAGSGAAVDLLLARVALALGDLETATSRAGRHTSGETAAEAYRILGGAAYVRGQAAEAEGHFLNAVNADPGSSTAYSDLGLALAVQGKAADALECFRRAAKLDPIDNPVMPHLGPAFLLLSAGKDAEAVEALTKLEDDNPRDLLVRFLLGYAKELAGDRDGAAKLYNAVLDEDHRYRVAIARLGVVQAHRVEETGDTKLVKEAVAHLRKAVALNPGDVVLPYVLGRFIIGLEPQVLADNNIRIKLADDMFARSQALEAPAGVENLPVWAQLARACLLYRDKSIEERRVRAQLANLQRRIEDLHPPGTIEKDLMKHEVYATVAECLEIVKETEDKVNKTWVFGSKPRDWEFFSIDPMKVSVSESRHRLEFSGIVDYDGAGVQMDNVLKHCAVRFRDTRTLVGKNFYELIVEGHIPERSQVGLGVGVVNPGRSRRGPAGVQIRRKSRTGTAEVRLDGGESQIFKQIKTKAYVDMKNVAWPTGDFRIHVAVERGKAARQQGRFRLMLNDTNVFETQLDMETERSAAFGRGRSNQQVHIYLWVEGPEGVEIPDIYVTKVVLTKAKK